MKQIIITADIDGSVEVKGAGFVGKECDEKLKAFTDALGTVSSSRKLPEYYQQANKTQKVGQ